MMTPDTVEITYDDLCSFIYAMSEKIKFARGYDANTISEETMEKIIDYHIEMGCPNVSIVDMLWNGREYFKFEDFVSHNGRKEDFAVFSENVEGDAREAYLLEYAKENNILFSYYEDDDDFTIFVW